MDKNLRNALKVCSHGDETTWGYLLYYDEGEKLWCVQLMSGTHNLDWWHDDEVTVMNE